MLDTPCSEVVWRVLATHSIRQFSLHFPSRASPCAITFKLDSTMYIWRHHTCTGQAIPLTKAQTQKCFAILRVSTTYSTFRYDTTPQRQVGPCKTWSVSTSGVTPAHDLSTVSMTSQHTEAIRVGVFIHKLQTEVQFFNGSDKSQALWLCGKSTGYLQTLSLN